MIDAATLQTVERPGTESFVGRYEAAEVTLRTKKPVAFDTVNEVMATGRFVLVDGFDVAGGGVIVADSYPRHTADSLHKSHNIFWTSGRVTAAQRALLQGHAGRVVWLTGLSCSGKTTIATELEREVFERGKSGYVLDGDNVRHGLCADLAFSPRGSSREYPSGWRGGQALCGCGSDLRDGLYLPLPRRPRRAPPQPAARSVRRGVFQHPGRGV